MKIRTITHKLSGLFKVALIALALSATAQISHAATGKIVFESHRDGNAEIYIMNADGTGQTNLTNNSAADIQCAISRDASKIAFSSNRTGAFQIYTMNADGSGLAQLTTQSGAGQPSWSPDGKTIVYALVNAPTNSPSGPLYTINTDGTNQKNIGQGLRPCFTRDGTKIVYTAPNGAAHYDIYVINTDGTNPVDLTNNQSHSDYNPDCSKTVDKIAFISDKGGSPQLYTMNLDGSNQTLLPLAASIDYPSWSPDNSRIAYVATRSSVSNIYTANADGSGETVLTSSGQDAIPSWGGLAPTGTPRPTPIVLPTPTPTPGPPSISYSGLSDGEALSTLPSVSGTATGGSQRVVASVTLSIRRNTDFFYFDGRNWVNFPVQLATMLSGNTAGTVNWVRRSGLPSGANLINASYTLAATVTNNAGVMDTNSINVILGVPDHTPPAVQIDTPTALTPYNTFPTIKGVANDRPRGTGLSRVVISIQRNSDGLYWTGTEFSFSRAFLPTTTSPNPAPGSSATVHFTFDNVPTGNLLRDGSYQIIARAYDIAGNYTGTTIFISIDQQAPTITLTAPRDGTAVNNLALIRGTVQDNQGGSGISRVRLTILRNIDGKYWNGTAFTSRVTFLPAILAGKTFVYHGSFPVSQLTQSSYTLSAIAFDRAGNQGMANSTVSIDRIAPTDVKFIVPTSSAKGGKVTVRTLPLISVAANDDLFGSGISRIDLNLQRAGDRAYYDGSGFTSRPTALTTTLAGGLYVYAPKFAAGALQDGVYILTAIVYDSAGNRSAPIPLTVTVDTTAPQQVTFTRPTQGATVPALSPISGTATDNANGSGIAKVALYIQRRSDGLYWTGRTWGNSTALATTLSAANASNTVTWTRSSGLPMDNNLKDDTYLLTALATDATGNVKSVTIAVMVNTLAPFSRTHRASSLALSRSAAQVLNSSVQLSFTGALAADSALDIERYQVTVNGHAVAVQSLAYNAATHTVTLGLGEAVLGHGDAVAVAWDNILDTQGRVVAGQAALSAR